jgi:hypothetical protein
VQVFDKFLNNSQKKFQRGNVNSQKKFQRGNFFRNRLHRLRDKVDGPTSKRPTDIDCGQSRLEHVGYQRKCHLLIVPEGEGAGLCVIKIRRNYKDINAALIYAC